MFWHVIVIKTYQLTRAINRCYESKLFRFAKNANPDRKYAKISVSGDNMNTSVLLVFVSLPTATLPTDASPVFYPFKV